MRNKEGLSPKKSRNVAGSQVHKRLKKPLFPRTPVCFISLRNTKPRITQKEFKNKLSVRKATLFSQMDPRPRVIHPIPFDPPAMPRMVVKIGKSSVIILFN